MIIQLLKVKGLDLMVVKGRIMITQLILRTNKIVYLKLTKLTRLIYLIHKYDMQKQLKMRLNN